MSVFPNSNTSQDRFLAFEFSANRNLFPSVFRFWTLSSWNLLHASETYTEGVCFSANTFQMFPIKNYFNFWAWDFLNQKDSTYTFGPKPVWNHI